MAEIELTAKSRQARRDLICSIAGISLVGFGCRRKVVEVESANASSIPSEKPTLPAAAGEIEFSYGIWSESDARRVQGNHPFKSGDGFRVVLKPAFDAHLYLFNRSNGEDRVDRLFPLGAIAIHNPLKASQETMIPDQKPLRFDRKAGTENITVVVATMALTELDSIPDNVPRGRFEQIITNVHQGFNPQSIRRFQEGDWTRVIASPQKQVAVILQLPLNHF